MQIHKAKLGYPEILGNESFFALDVTDILQEIKLEPLCIQIPSKSCELLHHAAVDRGLSLSWWLQDVLMSTVTVFLRVRGAVDGAVISDMNQSDIWASAKLLFQLLGYQFPPLPSLRVLVSSTVPLALPFDLSF